MKKLFIAFSTLSLLLIAFVACNDSDLPIEQPTQESPPLPRDCIAW